jgi:phosphate transport system substrate-binding protein
MMNAKRLKCVRGVLAVIAMTTLIACSPDRNETPTKGAMMALVSESVAPILKLERAEFEELYREAKVELKVTSTRDAIVQFFNADSIKTIVSSRPLNAEEQAAVKRYHLDFAEYKIAIDGVALIVSRDNPVAQLRTTQLDSLYCGLITRWSKLGWKSSSLSIGICLPDENAGEFEVVATKILHGGKFAPAAKVVGSSPEMLQYVAEHSNSIGMVSVGWLGNYKEKLRVLELCDPNAPDSLGIRGQYFSPHQAHLYRGYYPLTTEVYIYTRTDMYSVAAGFITFISSAPGQKIVLNSGLVPATMPVQLVELTNKSLQ